MASNALEEIEPSLGSKERSYELVVTSMKIFVESTEQLQGATKWLYLVK